MFSSINEGRLHDDFPIDLVFSLLHSLDLENLIILTICKVETLFIYFCMTHMCNIKHICFVMFVSV